MAGLIVHHSGKGDALSDLLLSTYKSYCPKNGNSFFSSASEGRLPYSQT